MDSLTLGGLRSEKLIPYLRARNALPYLTRIEALDMLLEAALIDLCAIRDDCDQPYTCVRAGVCPRAAKVRRLYKAAEHRVSHAVQP